MMAYIRQYAKGVIAWTIVIVVVIPFMLWGINEYFHGSGEVVVAQVGGRSISLEEYQSHYQRELATRRQLLGASFDPADPAIKRDVLDRLVNTELLSQVAARQGFRMGDASLGQQIHGMKEFQSDGRFDPDLYARLLRMSGMSQGQFEEDLRRDLIIQQVVGGVTGTAFVTSEEVDAALRLAQQQRKFSYLVLPASNYLGQVQVDDDRVRRFYEENLEHFEVPEQVVAQYVELSKDGLKASIPVDEAEVRRLYDERAATYSVGEERRAHHILIALDQEADEATVQKARVRAEDLMARLRHGESFEDLAREYSDDKGSATSGGDLGFFTRGTMVGPFEDAVFGMKKGEIKGPVRSPFGFHIIRLDQVRPGSKRSFDDVRAALEDEYRSGKAEEQFYDLSERLADQAFEHSDSLQPVADDLGLTVKEVGPFSREQGDGVAGEAAFRQAAFSQDVLEGGHNSAPIELGTDRLVVVRVKDRQPASHVPLDTVKESIVQELREQGAAELARKDGEAVIERIRQGKSPEEEAHAQRATWFPPALVRRDNDKVPPPVLNAAFGMGRPQNGVPLAGGVALFSGDYAVIALQEVVEGNPATVTAEQRKQQADQIAAQDRQRMVDEMVRSLKARTKVRLFEDKL
jgi:peptidyl-prolyl cis-trans isomerase D